MTGRRDCYIFRNKRDNVVNLRITEIIRDSFILSFAEFDRLFWIVYFGGQSACVDRKIDKRIGRSLFLFIRSVEGRGEGRDCVTVNCTKPA